MSCKRDYHRIGQRKGEGRSSGELLKGGANGRWEPEVDMPVEH